MDRDVKEIVGVLMHVLGGGEISQNDVMDLAFEADGELQTALNEAYIQLLEFVHDRGLRTSDRNIDRDMRAKLQSCLDQIVKASDRERRTVVRGAVVTETTKPN